EINVLFCRYFYELAWPLLNAPPARLIMPHQHPTNKMNREHSFMKLQTVLAAALATSVVAGPVVAQDRDGWPDNFTVGTASQGGTYFAYGSGWANFVAENLGVSGGAEITGGPV